MTTTVNMSTKASGGLGGMLKRAVSGASAFIIDFSATGAPGQAASARTFPARCCLSSWMQAVHYYAQHAFLVRREERPLDIFFTRKLGAGFFWRRRGSSCRN